jgi:outer membrane scaffolding protein for murein synthesis (MipA/OmpV family)
MAPPNPRQAVPPVAPDDVPAAPGAAHPWVLGLTMASSPSYTGGTARELSWRPVLAGRLGRWMVATSTARSMAGPELVGGLTTTLAESGRWSLGFGVRTTHGRSSGDDPTFSGLADVPASLALRASARYTLAPDWRLTAAWQQDVLKQQGAHINFGAGWSQHLAGGWLIDVSTGLTWADARAMNTFYSVPADATRTDRPAFAAAAGWEEWGWGVGVSRALSLHWRLSGSMGRGTLLGDAAHSPLTARASGTQAQVSVAYVGW